MVKTVQLMYAFRVFVQKIGDDPENPKRIKTVRSKGYLFVKETNGM